MNWWRVQRRHVRITLIVAVAAAATAGTVVAVKGHGTAHVPKGSGTDVTLSSVDRAAHPYLGFNSYWWRIPGAITPARFVRLLKIAGATMVRDTLEWEAIEPTKGKWDEAAWAKYTDFYKLLRAAHITPLWILQNSPTWASIQTTPPLFGQGPNCRAPYGCLGDPPARRYIPEFVRFAKEAVKRMPAAQFEVWNEPNLKTAWQPYDPDPVYFTRLQCAIYKGLKDVSPNTVVTSGGINSNTGGPGAMASSEFLRAAYDNGLNGCMDDLSVHVYPRADGVGGGSSFAQQWAAIVEARKQAGDTHPVYASEMGVATGGLEAVPDDDQKKLLQSAYDKLLSFRDVPGYPPIYAVVIHTLQDFTNFPGGRFMDPKSPEGHYGLLRVGASANPPPKPAWCWLVKAAKHNYPGC